MEFNKEKRRLKLNRQLMKNIQLNTSYRNAQHVIPLLAAIVTLVTFAYLILPAIALTQKKDVLDCCYEVHQHTDSCYEERKDEDGHTHKELVCGKADYVIHTHTDECYSTDDTGTTYLVCTLPEHPAHVHDEDCYEEEEVLVCDKEESEDHTHDASCYKTEKVLVCDQPELHTHTKACYDKDGNLTCGKLELKEHKHDKECMKKVEVEVHEEAEDPADSTVDVDQEEESLSEPADEPQNEDEDSPVADEEAEDSTPEVYKTESEEDEPSEDQTEEGLSMPANTFRGGANGITVVVNAEEGTFPADTVMKVEPVKDKDTLDQVSDAVKGKVEEVCALDITFYHQGNEIEPKKPVEVLMANDKVPEGENISSNIVHLDDKGKTEIIDHEKKNDNEKTLLFETDAFSVYAVVYTVDFEYVSSVDGKIYEYSIKGGDAIGLSQLLPILGVVKEDETTADINEIEEFINQIEDVQFSDTSLINVSKTEENTTVGAIKERLELKCENSADLSDDDVKEIDRKIIAEGDWALISLKAFDSEESLTITMKDGAVFLIKVTDANKTGTPDVGFFDNNNGYILYTEIDGVIYVMDTAGVPWRIDDPSMLDTMGVEYKWRFEYVYKEQSTGVNYYKVHPYNDNSKTIALNWSNQALVQTGTSQISIVPDGDGYVFEGYNNTKLANYDGWFAGARNGDYCRIMIYEQEHPETFNFTVTTANNEMGTVSGQNTSGQNASGDSFESITNGSASNTKTNRYPITAVPNNRYANNPKYLFDHWELDGNPLDKNTYGQTINAGRLELQHNNSVLKAFFIKNPNYDVPPEEKEPTPIDIDSLRNWLEEFKSKQVPLNPDGCKKTAEVYDYENRMYRVDLTSQASLATFEGTIDLGFIIDVSASMKFPSKLNAINNLSNIDIRTINDDSYGRKNWEWWGLDSSKTYYIISDEEGTSTVYKIYYKNNWQDKDNYWHTGWFCTDASKDINIKDNREFIGSWSNFKAVAANGNDNNFHYQFYDDGDPGKTRSYYLERSLEGTITELNDILGVLSLAQDSNDDPDVKIAYNTFCNYLPDQEVDGKKSHQYEFESVKDGISLQYDPSIYAGGTSTDIALLDAAGLRRTDVKKDSDVHSTDKNVYGGWKKTESDYNGGRTYVDYADPNKGFQWENSSTKYAVLITDGAPQRGNAIYDGYVKEAAKKLKEKGVTLITVGLSMDNVTGGKRLLFDIADKGQDDEKLFYSAKSGDELQYVLLEIIKQIIKDATVQGDVTDTIDEAFYPVNKETGKPLENGQMIDLEGNLTTDSSAPHGTIKRNNDGTYTVDWTNQAFTVDGWHGTVYVKAKEDLLGGNAITTNEGDAVIESKTYTLPGQTQPIQLKNAPNELQTKTVSLTTPRVNVNELSFTHNDNEWTVYLGTEVDPKAELIKMYNNILVEEVVTNASDNDHDGLPDKISSTGELRYPLAEAISDQREGFATGEPQTFYLKDLISKITNGSISDGSKLDWNTLIAEANKGDQNKGITIPYHEYGINDNSNITIKLIKTVVNGETGIETSPHTTSVTGDEVEKYTLTVLYSPDYTVLPVGQGGQSQIDFQTGQYGTKYAGHGAGTEDSNNVHIINVFAKGLQITKKDENWVKNLTGAEFKLYKEKDGVTKEVDGLTKNGAVFTLEHFVYEEGATYYLKETKAPDGYNLLGSTIPVTLTLNNSYTPKPDGQAQDTKPGNNVVYDWTQTASLSLGPNYTRLVDANGEETGPVATDSEDATVYYQIMNNPGVALPHTGGPGTALFYLLGSLLLIGAGVLLIRRRDGSLSC